ncbi:isoleucyl-tRNA synthetase [Podila verticillata NRRL 6337]|nr:MAG: Isoleucyl-tRNA synthetase [Podila humilis]KFH67734.1 isoleucyl-tRNA synthetase [Podila verticillata NRRL 6337]
MSTIKDTQAKRAPKEKPDQKYASTLLLPTTNFPLRGDALNREHLFRQRATSDLYAWQREHNPNSLFILHDGPPYANGPLHLGHALNKVLKDFINRQKVMKGHKVDYRPGWDCHGLPIELKALATFVNNKNDSNNQEYTSVDIRNVSKATAASAVEAQKKDFLSYGVMADWDNAYKTMDRDYEVQQLNVFFGMMKKGLIYRANKPVYWSPSSQTALAEAELEYNDKHASLTAWVAFTLKKLSPSLQKLLPEDTTVQAVVWTTTPWTLPANRCVAVHPKMVYNLFRTNSTSHPDNVYIAAKDLMGEMQARFAHGRPQQQQQAEVTLTVLGEVFGQDLVGCEYLHPFSDDLLLPFILADYVTADTGSGLVHTAPGHGMDDYKACKALGIDPFCPVDRNGLFTAEAGPVFEGKDVLGDGAVQVFKELAHRGSLVDKQKYVHKYPYDWRTKKPVIQRATPQWFADVDSIKPNVLKALESVRIVPEAGRRRLEGFVLSRTEWCISRQRSWGVPIPVFYDRETDEPLMTPASVQHVIDVVREHGSDAWWSMSDAELLAPEYDSSRYRRGLDTMDVWFDSGTSWTMIQNKMPRPDQPFVADVYLEGSDQHRGWFQSSLLTSVALTGKAPYGTLITHGFLLDDKGFKQSKSVGNTTDPKVVMKGGEDLKKDPAYGTDVLRLWAASSEYTKDISIGKTILAQVAESLRKFRATARFMLGNLDGFKAADMVPYEDLGLLERIMLVEVFDFMQGVDAAYDSFSFNKVFGLLQHFSSSSLSAFYLDVAKDTLYSELKDSPKRRAVQTVLFHALNAFTQSIAPLAPHFAEEVYENYRDSTSSPQPSVFRCPWWTAPSEWDNASSRKQFVALKALRSTATNLLERARMAKVLGPSLEGVVEVQLPLEDEKSYLGELVSSFAAQVATYVIVSGVTVTRVAAADRTDDAPQEGVFTADVSVPEMGSCRLAVQKASRNKCQRCWMYTSAQADAVCSRCADVLAQVN